MSSSDDPRNADDRRRVLLQIAGLGLGWSLADAAHAQTTVTYTYDVLGRVTAVTYPDGKVLAYTYDPAGNRTLVNNTVPPPPPLSVVVAPTQVGGAGGEPTPPVTATVSGGVPPYSYLWQRVSGSTKIIALDPTYAVTEFGWDGALTGLAKLSNWRVRVTDSASTIIYSSPNVLVTYDPEG